MRKNPTKRIEHCRVMSGSMSSQHGDGANGAFLIDRPDGVLVVVASDGTDWSDAGMPLPAWEHVSVSLSSRCPTWEEMTFVKKIFWRPDEVVVQFHPREEQYVNLHPFCLHMWKPIGVDIPVPPTIAVGPLQTAGG